MNKYGLKNVAEKKFQQMMASTVIYGAAFPRIKLFGRFLELTEGKELGYLEYNKYQELVDKCVDQILNFKIDESEERQLIPLAKAIDYYRTLFEGKMQPPEVQT